MKATILDGSFANDPTAERVRAALMAQLAARSWESEHILLREQKIGNCAGDFFCWIRNPGMCNIDDDNRVIAAKIAQSDLLIYLTPVTFGGYSSALKRMVDHQIQNIAPFFTTVNGEIHHKKRYQSYPNALIIGWMDTPDPQAEAIFRHLAYRNALNMYAKTHVCGIVASATPEAELVAETSHWLEAIARRTNDPKPALPETGMSHADGSPARRAVLLVGSPRTSKSTSISLGGYLFEKLAAHGVQTEILNLYPAFSSAEKRKAALETIDSADLVVLAFPLYVDSLPAPVIAALETIAAHRADIPSPARFAAIANCGFPEAHHSNTALAICAQFARTAGFDWMGSLALGGGEGIIHGTPLKELDGRAFAIIQSLDLTAEALAAGQPIPQQARDLMARPIIPAWTYKIFGGFGWKRQAKQWGVEKQLYRRPYEKAKS